MFEANLLEVYIILHAKYYLNVTVPSKSNDTGERNFERKCPVYWGTDAHFRSKLLTSSRIVAFARYGHSLSDSKLYRSNFFGGHPVYNR